jgi:hypothetical protein
MHIEREPNAKPDDEAEGSACIGEEADEVFGFTDTGRIATAFKKPVASGHEDQDFEQVGMDESEGSCCGSTGEPEGSIGEIATEIDEERDS